MNFIKWFVVSVSSLMTFWVISWLISLFIIKTGIEAVSSIQHDSLESIKKQEIEMKRDMIKDARALFPVIKSPTKPLKVAEIEFTKPRKSSISRADKLCNDAIFAAMGDRSDEAKQSKRDACAHNVK
jgi:hypothetical protein